MARPLTVMLVAAEASGDDRGAGLMEALRLKLGPNAVRFVGVGGPRMTAAGIASPFDIASLSILGLVEGLLALPQVVRRVRQTAALAAIEKPDVAVLIDSWGFTLRVAQALRRQQPDLPLIKYVGPQVWASRPGRARTAAGAFDHLLAIHNFDAPLFEAEGLSVTFVGNAALASGAADGDGPAFRREFGVRQDQALLLVAPGSRPGEIERVLPPFAAAVDLLQAERPDLAVAVLAAPTVSVSVRQAVSTWRRPPIVVEGDVAKFDAMAAADVALACSGTVTTELALAGAPVVVGYRLGRLTHTILKRLIRTPYVTLFNIAARDFVAPELIQDDCNGPALAREVGRRLDDASLRDSQIAAQFAALQTMGRGGPDPSMAAAHAVLAVVDQPRRSTAT